MSVAQKGTPVTDTGSLEGDLRAWLAGVATFVTRPEVARMLRAIAAVGNEVPGVMATRSHFFASRVEQFTEVVRRAQRRGELERDVDPVELGDLLVGPVYVRLLLTGAPVDAELVDRTVTRVLRAYGYPGAYPDSLGEDAHD